MNIRFTFCLLMKSSSLFLFFFFNSQVLCVSFSMRTEKSGTGMHVRSVNAVLKNVIQPDKKTPSISEDETAVDDYFGLFTLM